MSAAHGHRIETMNAALSDRMAGLARTLVGTEPTSRTATELRFRSRGSLTVAISGPRRGRWYDHEAGCGGDPLGLVAHLRSVPMRDALAWALAWLGEPPHQSRSPAVADRPVASPHAPREASDTDPSKSWSRDLADRLWREAVAPAGTVVEGYLASRSLMLPPDAPLRYHPRAWRNAENGPPGPAMVAAMTAPETGEWCGAHVTYLRPDGAGKAEGGRPKIMVGAAGIIRLTPDEDVTLGVGIAEGIETALSAAQHYGWSPVWAAGSAGAIARLPVLPGVECVTIFADPGGVGSDAAETCVARWAAAGREARICTPPGCGDFNDLARSAA